MASLKAVAVGACALLAFSCAPFEPTLEETSPASDGPELEGELDVGELDAELYRPTAACPGNRYVGQATTTSCPKPGISQLGRWDVANLFTPVRGRPAPPTGMERYCAYDWVPLRPGTAPDLRVLPRDGRFPASRWLRPDCQVLSPLAELSDSPIVWKELRETALEMTGAAPLPLVRRGPAQVRVAVVDSAVEGYDQGRAGKGAYGHGRAVGRTIRELSCPDDGVVGSNSACIGMVSNHLALPHVSPTVVDYTKGGYFGTQSELAAALFRAVEDWIDRQAKFGDQPRLVVNLSVGWDSLGSYGGAYPGNAAFLLPPPARSVHAAITHGVCHGALVVAAAGNASGGPRPGVGPMYPAAWETKPQPTLAECRRFEGNRFPANPPLPLLSTSGYRPLVFAVGGLDGRDRPLGSTRPLGRPRLAAYADHITSHDGTTHTEVLTGTSMSAAAVSGAAAAVWGYRPSLTATELMEVLYDAAPSLSPEPDGTAVGADFCQGLFCSSHSVRRVSLCHSLTLACAGGLEFCTGLSPQCLPSSDVPPYAGTGPFWTAADWDAALSTVAVLEQTAPAACSGCATPSAAQRTKSSTPWVDPQPGWSGCDVCGVTSDGVTATLYASISSDFPSWTGVTVTLRSDGAEAVYDLSSLVSSAASERTFIVEALPLPGGPLVEARISFGNGAYSTEEPLLLW